MNRIDLGSPMGVAIALLPEILLSGWALVVLLVVSWRHQTAEDSRLAGWLVLAGSAGERRGAGRALGRAGPRPTASPRWWRSIRSATARRRSRCSPPAGTVLISLGYLERERLLAPEYYPLILLATAGMMFLAGAEDLIVLFLGLEVMSVAVYVLAGLQPGRPVLLRGGAQVLPDRRLRLRIPALRHRAGLRRHRHHQSLADRRPARRAAAAADGGAGPRAAAHRDGLQDLGGAVPHVGARRLRRLAHAGERLHGHRREGGGVRGAGAGAAGGVPVGHRRSGSRSSPALAIASMVVGNLVALAQRSLKRMLAYSSIAHAGYMLVAVWTGTPGGRRRGAALSPGLRAHHPGELRIPHRAGPGRGAGRHLRRHRRPRGDPARRSPSGSASACSRCSGFPGTVGFIGKWYILTAAVAEGQMILPVILVLTSVLSAGYYLPVIMAMYMRPVAQRRTGTPASVSARPRPARSSLSRGGRAAASASGPVSCSIWPGSSARTLTQTAAAAWPGR